MAVKSPDERIYSLRSYLPWRDVRAAKWISYIFLLALLLTFPILLCTQRLAADLVAQHQTYVGRPDFYGLYSPIDLFLWYAHLIGLWSSYPAAVTAIIVRQFITFLVGVFIALAVYAMSYWAMWYFMGRSLPDVLGSGRAATIEEITAAGVLDNDGCFCGFLPIPIAVVARLRLLCAGRYREALAGHNLRPLRAPAEHHMLCVGPSGEGKTQDFILETESEWEGPMLIWDFKGDQAKKLAGYLSSDEGGHELHIIMLGKPEDKEMAAVVGSAWEGALNPLDAVTDFDDAKEIVLALREQNHAGEGKSDSAMSFFETLATELLQAAITYERLLHGDRATLERINYLVANERDAYVEKLLTTAHAPNGERRWTDPATGAPTNQHPSIRTVAAKVDDCTEDQKTSVFNLASNFLSPWLDSLVCRATSVTTFDAHKLIRRYAPGEKRPAIFLYNPYKKKKANAPVVRMMLQAMVRLAAGADVPFYTSENRLLVAIDELDSLGYIPFLNDDINELRSKGFTFLLGVQGRNMITARYGPNEPISMACRTQAYIRPIDDQSPKLLEERLGEAQLRTLAAPSSDTRHYGHAYQDFGRGVFKGYEIRRIPRDRALVFMAVDVPGRAGLHPIYAHRMHAAEEREYGYRTSRPLPWQPAPEVGDHESQSQH